MVHQEEAVLDRGRIHLEAVWDHLDRREEEGSWVVARIRREVVWAVAGDLRWEGGYRVTSLIVSDLSRLAASN